ncbi:MAG: hypothetical protein Q8Q00_12520 [Dehalococcoidia bacterium]|nr:hypothetical protein [Dehalococcoidia bacterium]
MARGRHPTWQENGNGFSPNGGLGGHETSGPRAFYIAIAAISLLFLLMTVAGVIVAQTTSHGAPAGGGVPVATAEPSATPQWEFAEAGAPDIQIEAGVADDPSSSTVQSPRTAASSWSAGPTPVAPAAAPEPVAEAERLAAEAARTYGVRIVLDGQDWGATEEAQADNVGAVISAMDRLPDTVISAVVSYPAGPLTFVSNNDGRTLDGWQPYGAHPMTYYTNSDQGPGGYHAAKEVVLSVGATSASIGHEIMHAYQARGVGPDEYALSLLQPEMRSFMAATGWRQTGSDEEVRAAIDQPWAVLNALYVYEGRPLTYTTGSGGSSTLVAANPFEAFAIAGSMYFTRPAWMPQPDWAEYWAWFESHLV